MTRVLRAEWVKLARPQILLAVAAAAMLYAVGSAAAGVLAAESTEQFAVAGGGSRSFTAASAFVGSFLLAVFAGAFGVEFSRGTLRTLLMRQPGRLRFLAGKLVALLLLAAVAVAAAEALSVGASALFASGQDIPTDAWFTGTGARAMAIDYGKVMLVVVGWALLGASLGVLVPSVPVALAIGVGWAGPVEQVVGEAWDPAAKWFPGLLLEGLLDPDPGSPTTTRTLITLASYAAVAAAGAVVALRRRDITS